MWINMPIRWLNSYLRMIPRLQSMESIRKSTEISVALGGDKKGSIFKEWKRKALGNKRRKFTPPPPVIAASVFQQLGGGVQLISEEQFLKNYEESDKTATPVRAVLKGVVASGQP